MNIKQVAAQAGVSASTVSRTINRPQKVDAETAERVWRAIRLSNYIPNGQARALVSGRSRIFGLIISDISNPFFPELVKSFDRAATRHNYDVLVASTDYRVDRLSTCVAKMIERQVDGLAIMTSELDRQHLDELYRRQLPMVFLDWGETTPLVSRIVVDYERGVSDAIRHLASLGHRKIAFISGPLALKSIHSRQRAFLKCLRELNIPSFKQVAMEGNHRVDGGEAVMRALLAQTDRPTAVLAASDLTAIGALHAIRAAGLEVPQDISLIGFDDIELSQYTHPPLTTIRLSREELGREAFDVLYRCAEGTTVEGQEIQIVTYLVLRESTGPLPAKILQDEWKPLKRNKAKRNKAKD
jgi:DNA-binding LacI/PurR family transcriptional regulator